MMSDKTRKIIGWSLTGLIGLALLMSAVMKIMPGGVAQEQSAAIGIDTATIQIIGIIELASLLLFVIPRTGIVGTLLLIAYFGGAISVHLVNDQSVVVPVLFEIVIWLTAALRFPELPKRILSH